MLFALAEFEQPELVARSLAAVLEDDLAPMADRSTLLALLLARPAAARPAWDHLQQIWPELERALPPILLARLAESTTEALPTDFAPRIRAFFDRNPLGAGNRVLLQIDESLEIAARFEARAGPALRAYLGT
jgi:hypothetical protein